MTANIQNFFQKSRQRSVVGKADDASSFTTALDHLVVPKKHPEYLKLIETPLAGLGDEHGHGGHDEDQSSSDNAHDRQGSTSSVDSLAPHPDEPKLKMPHEAPTIELFYDLYFVANLTVFSSQHEIHSWNGKCPGRSQSPQLTV